MNQMTPGKMAGKPAASRAAHKQGLEIAFDPDADPLADLAPDPFPAAADGEHGPAGPAGEQAPGDGPRDGAVRRAPRATGAARAGARQAGDEAPSASEALHDDSPDHRTAAGGQTRANAGADAPQPARHADPAEAARALGIPLPLAKIEVTVSVEVGRTRLSLADLVSVEPGELVALDRMTTAPVDILVNGKPFARGEIVAIGERFGVRLTELLDPGELA